MQIQHQQFSGLRTSMLLKNPNDPELKYLQLSSNLLNYEGEILNLTNLTSSESATYKCLGKNELGSKAIEYLVNVLETAQVNSISPEIKLILDKDKSATLSCTVRGNPMPVVAWIHNGKALASTSKLNIQKMFAQLTDGKSGISLPKNPFQVSIHSNLHKIGIDGLQLDLVFEKIHNNVAGKYSCYTFNAVGQDEKNTQVLVYGLWKEVWKKTILSFTADFGAIL